jgi:hypothetical protein
MSKLTSAATLCVLMFASSTLAHDPAGHAAHHEHFYKHLKQPGTDISCCNDKDCRPVKYRITAAGVLMEVGGKWISPPVSKVMERSDTDLAHWCGSYEFTSTPVTFCAIVPRGGV